RCVAAARVEAGHSPRRLASSEGSGNMRRLIACGLVAVVAAIAAPAAFGSNYIVLYKQQSVKSYAAATIQKAGGTLVYSYPAIGVVIASSTDPSFRDNLLEDSSVENAASPAGFAP